jgi:hypothetical protein
MTNDCEGYMVFYGLWSQEAEQIVKRHIQLSPLLESFVRDKSGLTYTFTSKTHSNQMYRALDLIARDLMNEGIEVDDWYARERQV